MRGLVAGERAARELGGAGRGGGAGVVGFGAAYRDTLGDLAMSLTGSFTGALIAASRTRLRTA